MSARRLTFGSLFAGSGAGDLGLEQADLECVAQVEIDASCQKVLAARFPDVPKWRDVTEVNGAELPACDLIIFGSPCQDLSVAGQRAGFQEGMRSNLFFEATRIIREMREATNNEFPRFALWENVPGAQSSSGGRDFGAALTALARSGAVDISWRIINAEHWVPQRRRRVFVLACYPPFATGRDGIGRASEILALSESVRRHPTKGREAGQDVAGTLGGGSGSRGWAADTERMTFVPEIARALAASTTTDHYDEGQQTYIAVPEVTRPLTAAMGRNWSGNGDLESSLIVSKTLTSRTGERRDSETETFVLEPQPMAFEARIARNGRGAPSPVSPPLKAQTSGTGKGDGAPLVFDWQAGPGVTMYSDESVVNGLVTQKTPAVYALQGGGKTSQGSQGSGWKEDTSFTLNTTDVHGDAVNVPRMAVRRLTPLECLRLQGLPDGWFDGLGLTDSVKYRMTGNAMATPVVRWIGTRIAEAAQGQPSCAPA